MKCKIQLLALGSCSICIVYMRPYGSIDRSINIIISYINFSISDQLTQDVCHVPCVSTGCLSRDSYHCIVEPIKKAQLPQKVAREASYSAPLLPYAGPNAPHSCQETYISVNSHFSIFVGRGGVTVNPNAPVDILLAFVFAFS